MAYDNEADDPVVRLLTSIDTTLKTMLKLAQQRQAKARTTTVADDRDLDGQYGDPEVRLTPRDWTGDNCKGRKMSECPAEFLDILAETLEYFAGKAEAKDERTSGGKPVADYNRKDAARARAWAKRIREGKVAAGPRPVAEAGWQGGF